ncbi:MAG: RING finger protein [Planctomycetota bacterium]
MNNPDPAIAVIFACLLTAFGLFFVFFVIRSIFFGELFNPFQDAFKSLATRRNGSFISSGGAPRVYFTANNYNFVVKGRSAQGSRVLTVSSMWPRPTFRLRVFHDKWTPGIKSFIGMQDIEIGSPDFDRQFVIQSNQMDEMLAVLSVDVQQQITTAGGDISLTINGGKIELQSVKQSFTEKEVFELVNRFVSLHTGMLHAVFAVPAMEMKVTRLENATCMVCGEVIENQRVDCVGCNTPHHKDCWQYLGVCSTYACGQKQYSEVVEPMEHPERFRITE